MKKLLLFAALFATAMVGRAQSFTVLHDGNPVENGSYVIVTDPEDYTDDGGVNYGLDYEVKLMVKNPNMTPKDYTGTLFWGSYPTKAQYVEAGDELVEGTECPIWGAPQICNDQGRCFTAEMDSNNEYVNLGKGPVTVPGMTSDGGFMYHLTTTPADLTSEYKTTIVCDENPDEVFECTLVFAPTEEAAKEFIANAGVNDIIADGDAAPVYYNLNGMKVANPSNGLYIVKRGSKVTKEVIR
ncbi:MAG: hypothetical protein K2J78_00120 [Muribaculaceae bacterium]|nr:hypothetical protein [Muribaculaceae bacterium]